MRDVFCVMHLKSVWSQVFIRLHEDCETLCEDEEIENLAMDTVREINDLESMQEYQNSSGGDSDGRKVEREREI